MILAILMLIAGLLTLSRGELKLTKRRKVHGDAARLVAAVLALGGAIDLGCFFSKAAPHFIGALALVVGLGIAFAKSSPLGTFRSNSDPRRGAP